jgi:hypothetical protein
LHCARYNGTEALGVGLGSIAEARLIHNAAGINPKFRLILFQESDAPHIPDTLQTYHKFPLYQPTALSDLIVWLASTSPLASAETPLILWPPPAASAHLGYGQSP